MQRHKETKKHRENLLNFKKYSNNHFEEFDFVFLDWMMKNNIPFSKLNDNNFTSLFTDVLNIKLRSRSYYKDNLLLKFYEQYCLKLEDKFSDCPFYLMFDKSPDSSSRKIVTILIGDLNENCSNKPYIIDTVDMETVNSSTIFDVLNFLIARIIKTPLKKSNFKMLISDKAAYAVKVGKLLKAIYPEIKHITCLCHGLHNFASFIKQKNKKCEEFEILFKKYFNKNKNKRINFKIITHLEFPKLPINTRWGSWIKFMIFIYNEYQKIEQFFKTISDDDQLSKTFMSAEFRNELIVINNFKDLPDIILKLESKELTVSEQIYLIQSFDTKISNDEYREKYALIWESNPDYNYFKNYNVLTCDENMRCLNYAPLTSVWVERSFSSYRYIYNDLRKKLTVNTLKILLAFYFNK